MGCFAGHLVQPRPPDSTYERSPVPIMVVHGTADKLVRYEEKTPTMNIPGAVFRFQCSEGFPQFLHGEDPGE